MKRIRATLIVIFTILSIALGLIVARALESVRFEREMRHRAVAERTFDEMERTLSGLLEREEERPFTQYHQLAEGRGVLAEDGHASYVSAYFQLDPDGALHVRDFTSGDGPPSGTPTPLAARILETIAELGRDEPLAVADEAPSPPSKSERAAVPPADALLRAAETKAIDRDSMTPKDLGEQQAPAPGRRDSLDAYEVLQSLNRADQVRRARQQKIAEAPQRGASYGSTEGASLAMESVAPRAPGALPPRADHADAPSEFARAKKSMALEEAEDLEADERFAGSVSMRQRPAEEALARVEDFAPASLEKEARARIEIDPMVGRKAGADHLLLYRTTLMGEQGYRQGLLVDTNRLARWLQDEVVEATGLARLSRIQFSSAGQTLPRPVGRGSFLYAHRFGEPFDSMQVVLDLDPLPGLASARSIYWLAAIASLVMLAGFIAVYRMVAVVVEFAERRNDFVAAVSHELKTPLTSIRMYGEMLRDGLVASPEKREAYYRNITEESERLSRLIDNVLEFSRSEKGNRNLAPHVGDLGQAVEEAASRLRPHVEREGFELETHIDPTLPSVRFDRDAVVQILFNLVDNALKYARAATTRKIVIECRRSGEAVDLAVRDFGPGVGDAQRARVFEPFHRGDGEATRATGGAGIGLALVKDLAEGMNAAIRGDDPDDGGFRVCLSFPAGPR